MKGFAELVGQGYGHGQAAVRDIKKKRMRGGRGFTAAKARDGRGQGCGAGAERAQAQAQARADLWEGAHAGRRRALFADHGPGHGLEPEGRVCCFRKTLSHVDSTRLQDTSHNQLQSHVVFFPARLRNGCIWPSVPFVQSRRSNAVVILRVPTRYSNSKSDFNSRALLFLLN